MNPFQAMAKNNRGSHLFKKVAELASFLDQHFGINHFWYYKIHLTGYYTCMGSHQAWEEFCYDTLCVKSFDCLRHPECLQKGVNFMKGAKDKEYQNMLDLAWEKFKINFNFSFVNAVPEGVESFGFATKFNDSQTETNLIKQIPTLHKITKDFKSGNQGLFDHIEECQVHLPTELQKYYERPKSLIVPYEEDEKLNLKEFREVLSLTAREKDILKLIARGYPTEFMAAKLDLCIKTVENYLTAVKSKLSCESLTDLIQKAQIIEKTNYFEF